ncbi:uncharacterized protein [Antedon mediterranea]|uniref:uncharacterized protein n=1 Tax=Antedon mediterranea TaxID=105859 RepID=UPI003AF9A487
MVHQRCCIPCCRNDSRTCEKAISFHGIPKDPVMRKKWLHKIDFTEDRLKKHTKVCSLHFSPDDFEPYELRRRMLRKGIVPTRFLKDEDGLHNLRPMRRRRNANKVSKEPIPSTIANPVATVAQNFQLPNISPIIPGRIMLSPNQIPFAFPFPYGMSPFLHPAAQMNSLLLHNQMENSLLRMQVPHAVNSQNVATLSVPTVHPQQLKECVPPQVVTNDTPIDLTQLKQDEQKNRNNSQILQQQPLPQLNGRPEAVNPMVLDPKQVKSKTSILWPMARLYHRGERHAEELTSEQFERQQADAALRQLTAQHQLMFASMNKQQELFPVTSLQSTATQEPIVFQTPTSSIPSHQNQFVGHMPDSLPPNIQHILNSEGAFSPQTPSLDLSPQPRTLMPQTGSSMPQTGTISPKSGTLSPQPVVLLPHPETLSPQTCPNIDIMSNSDVKIYSFSRQDSKRSLNNIISRLREKVTEDTPANSTGESNIKNGKNGYSKMYSPIDLTVKNANQVVTIMKVVEQQDEHTTTTKLMIELPPKEYHSRKNSASSKESRQIVLKVVQKKGKESNCQIPMKDDTVGKLKEDDSVCEDMPLDLSVREEKWVHTNGTTDSGIEKRGDWDDLYSSEVFNASSSYSKQLYQLPLARNSSQKDEISYDILQMLSSHDNPTQLLEDQDFTRRLFKFVGTCHASSCKVFNSSGEQEVPDEALDLSTNGVTIPYSAKDCNPQERGDQQLMTTSQEPEQKTTGDKSKNWKKYSMTFDKRLRVLHAKEAALFYETIYNFQMPEGKMDESYLLKNFSIQKVRLEGVPDQSVYFCNKCVKTLKDVNSALEHVKKHCERKRYKCNQCSKTYSSVGMIESHVEQYVPLNEKKLECDVCKKKFAFRGSLMMHLKLVHRDMEVVRCNLCHKEIKRHYLNTHMKRHRNERPHKCSICGKGFVAKKVLTTHLSIHTGYKPYKCQYCGRRFTVKSNMQLHERTHTGDRPFICNVCGKDFINRGTLKGHMLTRHHINLGKVHKCRHCTDSFTRLKTLVEHMEKAHKHLYRKDNATTPESRPQEEELIQDGAK